MKRYLRCINNEGIINPIDMELITVGKIYTYEPEYEGYTIYGNETSRINKMSELVYIKCNNDNFHHLESRRFIDVTWEIRNEKLESLGI